MICIRHIVFGFFVFASTLAAQDWELDCKAPSGYRNDASSSRHILDRRFQNSNERHRIELVILAKKGGSLESQVKSAKADTETLVEKVEPVEIATHKGFRATFVGPFGAKKEDRGSRRRLAIVALDEKHILKMTTLLVHDGPSPSQDLRRVADDAESFVLKSLKIERTKAPNAEVEAEREVANENLERFRNTTVVPFSFEYPKSWWVAFDDLQVGGAAWVIASPVANRSLNSSMDAIDVALRVNVVGYMPEILLADDRLSRAVEIVKVGLKADVEASVEFSQGTNALLGQARGRLIRYQIKGPNQRSGALLVMTASASIISADFRWPKSKSATYETTAIDVLNSFVVEADASRQQYEYGEFRLEYPERSWSLVPTGTTDSSRAVRLSRDDTRLLIRSFTFPSGRTLQGKQLAKLCRLLFARELKIGDESVFADGRIGMTPFGEPTWRCFFFDEGRCTDILAVVRNGALHIGILSNNSGIRSHVAGQAFDIFWSVSDQASGNAKKQMSPAAHYSSAVATPFLASGSFAGFDRVQLTLDTDGSAVLHSSSGREAGRYERAGEFVNFTVNGNQQKFRIRPDQSLVDSDGRVWFPIIEF